MEVAVGMNTVAVLLFWIVLAPMLFPTIDWSDFMSAWSGVRLITLHTVPAIATFTNLILSEVTMVPSDWKKVAAFGASYQVANYIATQDLGPIYPYLDWKNVPLTSAGYTAIGLLMGMFFYIAAK